MNGTVKSPAAAAPPSSTRPISIRVNDEPRRVDDGTTIADLIRELRLAEKKGVAIAVNNTVVARAGWPTHPLADGDCVLVIRATQGG